MTAVFEYTQITYIPDSSLAEVVYYNEKNYTMAVQFVDSSRQHKPSALYSAVPKEVYMAFVNSDSIGRAYNNMIKNKFPNMSSGTIHGVTYRPVDDKIETVVESKTVAADNSAEQFDFNVYGYVRVGNVVTATDRMEAARKFAESLTDDGYELDEIAVTEVTLNLE